ncbi:hypothetical protein EJB05_28477 [Eragrostis curvula]|uniref:WAT1-related protein n=1 Tax=Eragrostis curvula TaxID=38414 RepID=A0A5J9URE8_9POAL|nr:hypothetical protein EJB05_28477 [Eragrostis curvula]
MKTPYVVVIIIELMYTGMYVISKAALDQGMNPFVFTFYRQAAAALVLLPIALVFQRKNASSLSPRILLKMFFCALIGFTGSLGMCNLGITFTSATVATAATNSVPVFTFCFALLFRLEVMKLRSRSGIAKLAGIGLCLAGVLIIAFYLGPGLRPVNHHHAVAHASSPSHSPSRSTWIKGTFLMVLFSMTWSAWMLMQARLVDEYPNKMLVTVIECVFSVLQLFIIAVIAERDFSKWKLELNVTLLAIVYNGFVVTGISYYLQAWCMEMKGPVFLAMWTPLSFSLSTFCSWFFLGEIVHVGSIVGGALLVGGLYSVLWGKSKEPTIVSHSDTKTSHDSIQDEKGCHHKAQEEQEITWASEVEQV